MVLYPCLMILYCRFEVLNYICFTGDKIESSKNICLDSNSKAIHAGQVATQIWVSVLSTYSTVP